MNARRPAFVATLPRGPAKLPHAAKPDFKHVGGVVVDSQFATIKKSHICLGGLGFDTRP